MVCGSLAQLVEQRPEEPCVPSSSLGGATKIISRSLPKRGDFLLDFFRKTLAFLFFVRYNSEVFGPATLAQLVRAAVL